jgi:DNA-binding NarL/FixJ family response regulator
MIRLLSIEDHWIVIDGLKSTFRSDRDEIMITSGAESMDQALTIDPDLFDIILLDLLIPGTDPLDNVFKLQQRFPGKPIVIYTSEENSAWEDQMCEAGVQAYLTKHEDRKKLKAVLKQVAAGEDICKQNRLVLQRQTIHLKQDKNNSYLKPNEKAILSLFLQDMNLKEISQKINATESAISKTMAKLRKQFNVKTNSALGRIILEQKLISPPHSNR